MGEFGYRSAWRAVFASALWVAQIAAADPAWLTKQAAQWTEEDARQVLTQSPWVTEIGAGVAGRISEEILREGGIVGQPHGLGYDGVDPKGSGPKVSLNVFTGSGGDDRSQRSLPRTIALKLSWETALPVRLAERKISGMELPASDGDGYQIAVYCIPGIHFNEDPKQLGDPLRTRAALKRKGKRDAKPVRVEAYERQDGIVAVYLFPLSAEISGKDEWVRFEAHIGRIYVSHAFNLREMEFHGRLEL